MQNPYDTKEAESLKKNKGPIIEKYERISRRRMALGTIKEVLQVVVLALIAVLALMMIRAAAMAEPETVSGEPAETVIEPAVTVEPSEAAWTPSEDVPLDPELQVYIHDACETYDVPEPLVLALIEHESGFNPKASNGTCYGLMQIHRINYGWLREAGIEPLEYPGNIEAGVLKLGNLLDKHAAPHKALMAYNAGESGAKRVWDQGIYTSAFSRSVMRAAEKYEKE
jgi:soluble lytic murein transglycosylase-like protein